MRIKKGFNKRTVCGEQIIVATGKENIDFSNIICINESASLLWDNVVGKDFSIQDLATLLIENYNVNETTAINDANRIARKFIEACIVEE